MEIIAENQTAAATLEPLTVIVVFDETRYANWRAVGCCPIHDETGVNRLRLNVFILDSRCVFFFILPRAPLLTVWWDTWCWVRGAACGSIEVKLLPTSTMTQVKQSITRETNIVPAEQMLLEGSYMPALACLAAASFRGTSRCATTARKLTTLRRCHHRHAMQWFVQPGRAFIATNLMCQPARTHLRTEPKKKNIART